MNTKAWLWALPVILWAILLAAGTALAQTQAANFTLTWVDQSNNEDGFKVERRLGQTGTFAQVAQVGANVVKFVDPIGADTGGITYCYQVRAFNTAGDSAYSNIACGTTPAVVVVPLAPSGLSVSVTVTVILK